MSLLITRPRLDFPKLKHIKWYSTKEKLAVPDHLHKILAHKEITYNHIPGIVKPRQFETPAWLLDTVKIILEDKKISKKLIYERGEKLSAYLWDRRPPVEKDQFNETLDKIKTSLQGKVSEDILANKETLMRDPTVKNLLKRTLYNWAPIRYDHLMSLTYLLSRSVPEHGVLCKIFNEIKTHDDNFKPETLFDFGSGVGTVIWAASQFWLESLKEYYCVDVSSDMNDLSEYLIKRAEPKISQRYIFYRQYLPVSTTLSHDIVVSAYSLFELPNQRSRLEVIANLWRKTLNYLVVVERGSYSGFTLVNEVRDFILNCEGDVGHVLSPCPHDLECPKHGHKNRCHFHTKYLGLPIHRVPGSHSDEFYSYVIFKKGEPPKDRGWPRIISDTLIRSGHVICRVCTSSGKFEEHVFTKFKDGPTTYRCARKCKWGDRLPFEVVKPEPAE